MSNYKGYRNMYLYIYCCIYDFMHYLLTASLVDKMKN